MAEAMLDFETMGTDHDCAVVQIGAVLFDKDDIRGEFIVNVDLESELSMGFTETISTIKWWDEQEALHGEPTWKKDPKLRTHQAFAQVEQFLRPASRVWSHATFDAVILNYHYSVLGIRGKKYSAYLDLRTLSFLTMRTTYIPQEERPEGIHDALVDARYQAEYAQKCFAKLRGE